MTTTPASWAPPTWKTGSCAMWMRDAFGKFCQTALEGLAAKKLNLEMLVERRARAQERRVVPEAIARFLSGELRQRSLHTQPGQPPAAYIPAGPDADRLKELRARSRLAFS